MSDLPIGEELFNYMHTEVSDDFGGYDIRKAIIKDHAWLKNQNKYLEEKRSSLEIENSELRKRLELLTKTVVFYAKLQNEAVNSPVVVRNFNKAVLCCGELGINYNDYPVNENSEEVKNGK